jgi:hypothetical protein
MEKVMVTSKKTGLMGILGLVIAVSATIASAHSDSLGAARPGTASNPISHSRTVFNPIAGKEDLSHGAIQP